MNNSSHYSRTAVFHMNMSEFWSGDLGLTLVSLSLGILIFVIFPLHRAGLAGRFVFDVIMVSLMVSGALVTNQSRLLTAITVGIVILGASVLWAARLYPSPMLDQVSSAFSVVAFLIYIRIVLLVMFREGPVSWSRIQGGVCAYLLVGMAWASAFALIEQIHPGSFHFASHPGSLFQFHDSHYRGVW